MQFILFVIGAISLVVAVWLLNKFRSRPGMDRPKWLVARGMSETFVFVTLGLVILGVGLMAKAFTG